ncbi:bifunctional UDP-sugar hydrolase/5'-nucleotidase [Aneurinibacillus aneurinilyticus]|uniref:bifunctional metallophosphatase/5'-nucleotidase n=1 Tax=Aneurinibacillus aneurinilyticus TaxID=1391 RepID=UPI002E1B3B36|nr:bifunctional UDP-sugar hydrolase/5'-nucleotidase [Aneurinibacillus aneurinilyticus]
MEKGEGILHILHTNDLHSHFEWMSCIAAGLKSIRLAVQEREEPVVTVDLGDHMDRAQLKTEATWGQANIDVLNETGYDLATIGNNEGLTFPRIKLDQLYRNATFPVICANLLDAKTKQIPPFLKPYLIKQYGDLTVGWIGITASFSSVYELLGLTALVPEKVVAEYVAAIRSRVDLIVILSHIGYSGDVEMARSIKGIDIILGAHTHTYLAEGEMVKNTLICQTGKFGEYIGHVTVTYDKQTKAVQKMRADCLPTRLYEPDKKIEEVIERHQERAENIMGEVITSLKYDLPVSWEEESPLSNLLAAGLRVWVDAEISLVNSGTLLFSLRKGKVTRKDLLSLCPHPINPCRMKLNGRQLLVILEEALDASVIHREVNGFGFRGKVIGWLSIDGAEVYYDKHAPVGRRIKRVEIQGAPLQEERLYTVGTIDMFTFGIIFPMFKQGTENKFYLPEFLRDVLQKQLQDEKELQKTAHKRWHEI